MRRFALLVIVPLALSASVFPQAQTSSSAKVYLSRTTSRSVVGNYDAAIAHDTKTIDLYEAALGGSGSTEIRNHLVEAYNSRGAARIETNQDIDGAIADFTRAIKLDELAFAVAESHEIKERLADAYYNRGDARMKDKRDLDGAIADFDRAIILNPRYISAYHQRGLARQLKNDSEGAKADLEKAVEIANEITTRVRASIPSSRLSLGSPALPEGVVVQVNDNYITVATVAERVRMTASELAKRRGIPVEQAQNEISKDQAKFIAELIKQQFITQQVQRLKLSSEIEQMVDRAVSRARRDHGVADPATLREPQRKQITRDLVFVRVCWRVYFNPNSSEVRQYFDKHPEKFLGEILSDAVIRGRMQEEWKNAEILSELTRTSYINVAEPYRISVMKELTEPIQLASDIPRGRPRNTRNWSLGDYIIGCGIVPIATHGYVGIGPCRPEAIALSETRREDKFKYGHYHRAIKKMGNDDILGAIKEFTEAIEAYPEFADAYAGRGIARLMLGKEAEAERDIQKALELDPSLKDQIEKETDRIKQQRRK